jgi:NADPH:quinone reductase-like Zn-dependent oxidoreductase
MSRDGQDLIMRAAWFEEFGTAADVLKVGEFDTPVAGPGEVLVRLHASGVNPSDVKKRTGSFPNLLDAGPVIPNSDGAGIIEAVGEGVSTKRVGERVWIYQAQFARRLGTAAEFVAIDSERAPRLPDNTDFDVGACLGIPAMTAHRCVFADGNVDGQKILVTGGAGRVGFYAVQWASQAGATVIATASNKEDADACIAAGASKIVNHRDDNFAQAILDASDGELMDRIVDVEFGANLQTSIDVIRTGGVIATYSSMQDAQPKLPFLQMMYKDLTIRMVIVYSMPESAKQFAIADIERALSAGQLQHRIAQTFPLDDIAKSNELVEQSGVRGSVVLQT